MVILNQRESKKREVTRMQLSDRGFSYGDNCAKIELKDSFTLSK